MGSSATTRDWQPAPLGQVAALTMLLTLPAAVIGAVVIADGALGAPNADYLLRARVLLDRGRLEFLGVGYPPLPFLALLPAPEPWLAWSLGSLALSILTWTVVRSALDRGDLLPVVVLASVTLTPLVLHFIVVDFNEILALVCVVRGWRRVRMWAQRRLTIDGMLAGLAFGLGALASPWALVVGALLATTIPIAFRHETREAQAAQILLFLFPVFAVLVSLGYLAWVFNVQTLVGDATVTESPSFRYVMLAAGPALVVGALRVRRGDRAPQYWVALGGLLLLVAMGQALSTALAALTLAIVALTASPRRLGATARGVLVAAAMMQVVALWLVTPLPRTAHDTGNDRALAAALERAPPRAVLVGKAECVSVVRWMRTVHSLLLPQDPAYGLALDLPDRVVRYVLLQENGALARRFAGHPPRGFVREWRGGGYALYRRFDAPPLAPDRRDRVGPGMSS